MNIAEKYGLALLQLQAYSDNELIKVDGITLNINDELAEVSRIKNEPQELFLLYQTDFHISHSSKVCFGVFDSKEKAEFAGNENNLTENESKIHIEECTLNKFEEF